MEVLGSLAPAFELPTAFAVALDSNKAGYWWAASLRFHLPMPSKDKTKARVIHAANLPCVLLLVHLSFCDSQVPSKHTVGGFVPRHWK